MIIGYLKLPVLFMPIWIFYRANKKIYEKFIKAYEIVKALDGTLKISTTFLLKRFIPMILIYVLVCCIMLPIAPKFDLKGDAPSTLTYYISRFMPHICGLLGIMQVVMLLGCIAKFMHQIEVFVRSLEKH